MDPQAQGLMDPLFHPLNIRSTWLWSIAVIIDLTFRVLNVFIEWESNRGRSRALVGEWLISIGKSFAVMTFAKHRPALAQAVAEALYLWDQV